MFCDIDLLKEVAGPKVFARGEDYFQSGQVVLLSRDEGRVWARVYGSEAYETFLESLENDLDGDCTCPAFEDWGFCKHMVAVALAANAQPPRASGQSGLHDLLDISTFLKRCDHETLVMLLAEFAEADIRFFRKLRRRLQLMPSDDPEAEARFRSQIEVSLQLLDEMEEVYDETGYREVEELISRLEEWIAHGQADVALRLSTHLMDHLLKEVGTLTLASGYCEALLEEAARVHLLACEAVTPDPEELAKEIFEREMKGAYFGAACGAAFYAGVLGEAGLATYRRLVEETWRETPAMPPAKPERRYTPEGPAVTQLLRLSAMKDYLGWLDADVDARIAARKRNLSSPQHYIGLVRFCLEEERPKEAQGYLEEGQWVFPEATSNRTFAIEFAELLEQLGRKERACGLLQESFRAAPDEEVYNRLSRLGGEEAAKGALESLHARIGEEQGPWRTRLESILLRILMRREEFDQAWELTSDIALSPEPLMKLAEASEATHPDKARAVYEQEVERLVESGGNGNYHRACEVVSRLGKLQGPRCHGDYVEELSQRYRRKRNFMKLLEQYS